MKSFFITLFILAAITPYQLFSEEKPFDVFYANAKEECHDIAAIRTAMDKINNEILVLMTKRSAYVKRAGDLKSQTTKIADDRARVAAQETKIIEKSTELGLPIEISIPAFRALVENSIEFQQRYIDQELLVVH